MVKLNRRQLLLAGLMTGGATALMVESLQRQRNEALQAIAVAQMDTDTLLETAFHQEVIGLNQLRGIQAAIEPANPTVAYEREMSKRLIIGNKLTTQQYIYGKVDPTYDGSIAALPLYDDRFARYTQIASFKGLEDENIEEVTITRPTHGPLHQVRSQFYRNLAHSKSQVEDTIQEVVKLRRNVPVYYGFVLESDEHALVIFRGTQRQAEWINNITALHEDYRHETTQKTYGRVHAGFHAKYHELTHPTPLEIIRRLPPSKPCYISGHSLGGALATLTAIDAALHLPEHRPQLRLYTYASPRVGNVEFVNAYHQLVPNSYRIVNLADAVPLMPPRQLEGIYVHVGQKWSFLSQNEDVLPNHQIDTYRQAIEQEAEQQAIDAYVNLRVI